MGSKESMARMAEAVVQWWDVHKISCFLKRDHLFHEDPLLHHRPQVEAYRKCREEITGEAVKEAGFLDRCRETSFMI